MAKVFRRTISMDNIAMPTAPSQSDVPVYRNPRRDDLHDEQSLMDRTSIAPSNNYEPTDNFPLGPSKATEPFFHQRPKERNGTRRSTISILPFDGKDEKLSINDFFILYERMANANSWAPHEKFDQLFWNLKGEPQRVCDELLKEDIKDFEVLKQELIKRFGKKFTSTHDVNRMINRKFNREMETLDDYFTDKIWSIVNFEPTMSTKAKRGLIIDGLDSFPELMHEALKEERIHSDQPLEDLRDTLNFLIKVMDQTRPVQSREKKVRFDNRPITRDSFESNRGRASYQRSPILNSNNSQQRNRSVSFNQMDIGFNPNHRNNGWTNINGRNSNSNFQRSDYNRNNRSSYYNSNGSNNGSGNENRNDNRRESRVFDNPIRRQFPERTPSTNSNRPNTGGMNGPKGVCFECNQPGHYRYNCPKLAQQKEASKNL